ncbi:hypothetical protein XENOCAPTIV_007207 [Xenoophorus captivus]|uniref:Uncharacterized protein n=1 Tax=Xenoophorus captivus TaxID=1517983 RepID=A0ABV0QQF4_9TELE
MMFFSQKRSVLRGLPVSPAARTACTSTPVFYNVLRLASFHLFPPNVTIAFMDQHFNLRAFTIFVLNVFASCNLFGSNGFLLSERPFNPCWYRTHLSVDNNILLQASASIF